MCIENSEKIKTSEFCYGESIIMWDYEEALNDEFPEYFYCDTCDAIDYNKELSSPHLKVSWIELGKWIE